MPLYTVSTKKPLTHDVRDQLAAGITQLHCDATGAPAEFVQVVFSFNVPLGKHKQVHLLGSIRSGRSSETKQLIISRFHQLFHTVLRTTEDQAVVQLMDVPASWVIEGGDIMPEPGEEAEWLENRTASRQN